MNDDLIDRGHPAWDVLNDVADRRVAAVGGAMDGVPAGTPEDVTAHVAICATCQATVASIRALSREASALASGATPPPALWGDIARSIAAAGRSPAPDPVATPRRGPAPGAPVALPRRTYAFAPRTLAAAALVLMALTSGMTALLLRARDPRATPVAVVPSPASMAPVAAGGGPVLPASFAATESAFLADLASLHAAFLAQRSALAPPTVAIVEHALATIDAAIAEARAALVADPANQSLAELLSTTYQQKVELLRRATEYSAS